MPSFANEWRWHRTGVEWNEWDFMGLMGRIRPISPIPIRMPVFR